MPVPLIAAAAAAGSIMQGAGDILGGVLGYKSQKKQLKLQAQEAARQGAISQKQLEMAERMIELGLATQVDARGNITVYDKDTNTWKTVLSDEQKQIADASDREQLQQLTVDAPMARGEALRNSQLRSREMGTAQGMLSGVQDQLSGKGSLRAGDIASSLRMSRSKAVNQGFDQVGSAIATQALRSGKSAAGAATALAKSRSQAIASTMGNPDLEGMQMADDQNATRLGNSINNYGAIASRATNSGGFSFSPSNIAPNLSASALNLRGGAQSGLGQSAYSLANAGRPIQVPGVYNPAGLITTGANALGSMADSLLRSRSGPQFNGDIYDYSQPLTRNPNQDPRNRAVSGSDWKAALGGDW